MKPYTQTVGIEQIDNVVINHEKFNPKSLVTFVVWAILTAALFGVVGSCDDSNGMYQGPNDSTPRYGGPK